jgi:hypothetical protein
MCEYFGYKVVALLRVRIMNISIDGIERGRYRKLTLPEVEKLLGLVAGSGKTASPKRIAAPAVPLYKEKVQERLDVKRQKLEGGKGYKKDFKTDFKKDIKKDFKKDFKSGGKAEKPATGSKRFDKNKGLEPKAKPKYSRDAKAAPARKNGTSGAPKKGALGAKKYAKAGGKPTAKSAAKPAAKPANPGVRVAAKPKAAKGAKGGSSYADYKKGAGSKGRRGR